MMVSRAEFPSITVTCVRLAVSLSSIAFLPLSLSLSSPLSMPMSLWQADPLSTSEEAKLAASLGISPLDDANARLLNEVRPKSYVNPVPLQEYDLLVIGAGAGGLVSSRQAARRGATSCMITSHLAGGDCLNSGCVPSKALLRCAKLVRETRKAADPHNPYGIRLIPRSPNDRKSHDSSPHKDRLQDETVQVAVNFSQVMQRMRNLRADIAPIDGHARGSSLGVQIFQGKGVFLSPNTVEVISHGNKLGHASNPRLKFRKAVIATGGEPKIPGDVPGLKNAPYTTNWNLFNLNTLPERMIILGAGIVALEMAQAFAAFGSKVTILERSSSLLSGRDNEAAQVLKETLEKEGVTFLSEVKIHEVQTLRPLDHSAQEKSPSLPLMRLSLTHKNSLNSTESMECECFLIAIGRVANVQNIGLEAANISFHPTNGILVNDLAQSISNPHVYAVGDCVANVPRLTHMSGEMAKVVVQNALFPHDPWRLSSLVVPAVMYTDPEYAVVRQVITVNEKGHVIPTPLGKSNGGIVGDCDVYKMELKHNDRSILDSSDEKGFVKLYCTKGTGTIVGCTIVSTRAGEMINEVTLAIKFGIDLKGLARNIHSYPSLGEAVMGCGLQFVNSKWETLG